MTGQQYILHTTKTGDRWDLLGWKYYGDPTNYSGIVQANPSIPIEPIFEAGLLIAIPVIEATNAEPADLPPWEETT